jgi:hypothetical protein
MFELLKISDSNKNFDQSKKNQFIECSEVILEDLREKSKFDEVQKKIIILLIRQFKKLNYIFDFTEEKQQYLLFTLYYCLIHMEEYELVNDVQRMHLKSLKILFDRLDKVKVSDNETEKIK